MFPVREVEGSPSGGVEPGHRDGSDDMLIRDRPVRTRRCRAAVRREPEVAGALNAKRSETDVARRSTTCFWSGARLFSACLPRCGRSGLLRVTAAVVGDMGGRPFLRRLRAGFRCRVVCVRGTLTVRTSVLDGAKRTVLMGLSVFLAVGILRTIGTLAWPSSPSSSRRWPPASRCGSAERFAPNPRNSHLHPPPRNVGTDALLDSSGRHGRRRHRRRRLLRRLSGPSRPRARRVLAGLASSIVDLLFGDQRWGGEAADRNGRPTSGWRCGRRVGRGSRARGPLVDEAVAFLVWTPSAARRPWLADACARRPDALGRPTACHSPHALRPPALRGAAFAGESRRGAVPHGCGLPCPG